MLPTRRVPSDVQLDHRALAARRRAQPSVRNDRSCAMDESAADFEPSRAAESLAVALRAVPIHKRFDRAELSAEVRGMPIAARADRIIRSHATAVANRSTSSEAQC